MGQCLKNAYDERELAKTLAKVHGIIDEETQKLSDKLKNLTLSHNRKKKALKQILNLISDSHLNLIVLDMVKDICERALWSDGRFNIK